MSQVTGFHNRATNRYEEWTHLFFVFMIPLTASLAGYFLPLLQFHLDGFRIVLILSALFLFIRKARAVVFFDRTSRWYAILGYVWVTWGFVSSLWAPMIYPALSELSAVVLCFVTGIVLLNLVDNVETRITAFRMGWVAAVVATGTVAAWELITGNHLPGYFVQNSPPSELRGIVISTFVNPDNYSAFLVLSFPFLYWAFRIAKRSGKLPYVLLMVSSFFFLIKTQGRAGLVAILFELFLIFALSLREFRKLYRVILSAVALAGTVIVLILFAPKMLSKFVYMSTEVTQFGSTSERLNLTLNGVYFFWKSHFLGIGPGGFESYMLNGYGPFPTGHDIDPHNFWTQVLSQYGVLVFSFLIGWFLLCTLILWRGRSAAIRSGDRQAWLAAEAMLIGIAGYPLAAIEHSSYIKELINWTFIASILVVTTFVSYRVQRRANSAAVAQSLAAISEPITVSATEGE